MDYLKDHENSEFTCKILKGEDWDLLVSIMQQAAAGNAETPPESFLEDGKAALGPVNFNFVLEKVSSTKVTVEELKDRISDLENRFADLRKKCLSVVVKKGLSDSCKNEHEHCTKCNLSQPTLKEVRDEKKRVKQLLHCLQAATENALRKSIEQTKTRGVEHNFSLDDSTNQEIVLNLSTESATVVCSDMLLEESGTDEGLSRELSLFKSDEEVKKNFQALSTSAESEMAQYTNLAEASTTAGGTDFTHESIMQRKCGDKNSSLLSERPSLKNLPEELIQGGFLALTVVAETSPSDDEVEELIDGSTAASPKSGSSTGGGDFVKFKKSLPIEVIAKDTALCMPRRKESVIEYLEKDYIRSKIAKVVKEKLMETLTQKGQYSLEYLNRFDFDKEFESVINNYRVLNGLGMEKSTLNGTIQPTRAKEIPRVGSEKPLERFLQAGDTKPGKMESKRRSAYNIVRASHCFEEEEFIDIKMFFAHVIILPSCPTWPAMKIYNKFSSTYKKNLKLPNRKKQMVYISAPFVSGSSYALANIYFVISLTCFKSLSKCANLTNLLFQECSTILTSLDRKYSFNRVKEHLIQRNCSGIKNLRWGGKKDKSSHLPNSFKTSFWDHSSPHCDAIPYFQAGTKEKTLPRNKSCASCPVTSQRISNVQFSTSIAYYSKCSLIRLNASKVNSFSRLTYTSGNSSSECNSHSWEESREQLMATWNPKGSPLTSAKALMGDFKKVLLEEINKAVKFYSSGKRRS